MFCGGAVRRRTVVRVELGIRRDGRTERATSRRCRRRPRHASRRGPPCPRPSCPDPAAPTVHTDWHRSSSRQCVGRRRAALGMPAQRASWARHSPSLVTGASRIRRCGPRGPRQRPGRTVIRATSKFASRGRSGLGVSATSGPCRGPAGTSSGGIGQSSASAIARSRSPSAGVTRPSAAMHVAHASRIFFLIADEAAAMLASARSSTAGMPLSRNWIARGGSEIPRREHPSANARAAGSGRSCSTCAAPQAATDRVPRSEPVRCTGPRTGRA